MKKRLRKKLRLGEFQDWLFAVRLSYDATQIDSEALLDRFLDEAVEANDLFCGGGGRNGDWHFVIGYNSWPNMQEREAARRNFENWLREYSQDAPLQFAVGALFVDLGRVTERAPAAANRQRQSNRKNSIAEFDYEAALDI